MKSLGFTLLGSIATLILAYFLIWIPEQEKISQSIGALTEAYANKEVSQYVTILRLLRANKQNEAIERLETNLHFTLDSTGSVPEKVLEYIRQYPYDINAP
jgi:hypothetical protein